MTDASATRCSDCGGPLDEALLASCTVCPGLRLCLACARRHLCTDECAARGCHPGLCMRVVRDGVTAEAFGVPTHLAGSQ